MNEILDTTDASPFEQALDLAIEIAAQGSATKLAELLGVTKGAVSNWRRDGFVPAPHCPPIERLTNHKVRCEELNSKVEWAVLRQSGQSAQAAA